MKKIKPLIKWTGGKYSEFALFEKYIPSFNRYIEPFFGGGGVFFALQPTTEVLINDKSSDLINFYQTLTYPDLRSELLKYADAWDELSGICDGIWAKQASNYIAYINGDHENLDEQILVDFNERISKINLFSDISFLVHPDFFTRITLKSIIDKAKRIKIISNKEQRFFSSEELKSHFETGVKSGTYLFFRSLLNDHYQKKIKLPLIKSVANWYFVREFCYGSMFRFNVKGDFNIPYGGIAYNKKNFRKKLDNIFSTSVERLFKSVSIFNLDFDVFLKMANLIETDFIFVDPPYDSEFSEYDQSSFTRMDQQRLATTLLNTKAKWMVVIKDTPFIRSLYIDEGVNINIFSKNYRYNVRGRNNRTVQHLVITNYK